MNTKNQHRLKRSNKSKGLHPRNVHRDAYDFDALIKSCPELAPALRKNTRGEPSIDFSKPASVKLLNQSLLKHYYQVGFWDFPADYLCPPIPGRVDYLHYVADLLSESGGDIKASAQSKAKDREAPRGKRINVLDIGMGANCIYPIVGARAYGWHFVGADIDPVSVKLANMIADTNPALKGHIRCRLQKDSKHIFKGVIRDDELFDVTLCNPPFHESLAEATAGTERKLKNLGANAAKKGGNTGFYVKSAGSGKKPKLNFGGQGSELWCPGGELAFIRRMILESAEYAKQCLWFSTLVSKKENLSSVYRALKSVDAVDVRTINMEQGKKLTRIVAWTFLTVGEQAQWCRQRW